MSFDEIPDTRHKPERPSRATPHGIAAALKAEAPDVAKFIYHGDVRAGWRCFKRDARKIRMARHRRRGWGRS